MTIVRRGKLLRIACQHFLCACCDFLSLGRQWAFEGPFRVACAAAAAEHPFMLTWVRGLGGCRRQRVEDDPNGGKGKESRGRSRAQSRNQKRKKRYWSARREREESRRGGSGAQRAHTATNVDVRDKKVYAGYGCLTGRRALSVSPLLVDFGVCPPANPAPGLPFTPSSGARGAGWGNWRAANLLW